MIAPDYPNAPIRSCSRNFRDHFTSVFFTHIHCFYLPNNICCEDFVPFPNAYYSSILPSILQNKTPRALIAKTKSNQPQGWKATLSRVPHSCLICRYCLVFKIEVFNALQRDLALQPSTTQPQIENDDIT